jgi:two-component system chemotaxis sensor kinase CheA
MIEDEELRNLYQLSSVEHLQNLEVGLRHLQKYPDDETSLEELRREAHSLKGDSRSVGVDTVETFAHALEDILSSIKRQEIVLTPQLERSRLSRIRGDWLIGTGSRYCPTEWG